MRITEAKKTPRGLSLQRKGILGDAPEIIMQMDKNKRYTWANPAGVEFFGPDVVGREAARFSWGTPETEEKVQALLDGRNEEIQVESLQRRRDGAPRFLDWRGRGIKDKSGQVIGALYLGRDITERKQMEEKLKSSETRYRRLFESAKDGILILDAVSGEIVDANPFIEELLGYAAGELLGQPLWDIGPFRNIVATKEAFEELLYKEYIRYEDLPLESKDGRRVAVEFVSNVYLVDGQKVIQCNIRDITERKRAQEERARLVMAIEHAADAVVVTDSSGAIEYVNPAFQKVTGYAREEVIGANLRILKSDTHDEAFYKDLWDTLTRGEVWSGRFTNRKKDRSLYEEEGTISPVVDGAGRLVGYVAIKRDISERLALERAAEFNRHLAQIGELASGVVHELRNPLAVIAGTAEILQRKIATADPLQKPLNVILTESKHLERSIAQFLNFARPFEVTAIPCRPETVAERTRKLCEPRAAAKHVTLGVTAEPGLPEFKVDPGKLAQAVVNIVNNAIDAAPANGRVALHVARDDLGILFKVTDNGPGIHLGRNEDIFTPFFSKKEGGTGLGLSVARRIVAAHGGTITFRNQEKGGLSFLLRVPIQKEVQRS
jgi:PAS domain S-box-containing protein